MRSRERDLEHYIERRLKIFGDGSLQDALRNWKERVDIHMHVFTIDSFRELCDYVTSLFPFRKVFIDEGAFEGAVEFYAVLMK